MTEYRPCNMKGGIRCCAATPRIIIECGCRSCAHLQHMLNDPRDPFLAKLGYKNPLQRGGPAAAGVSSISSAAEELMRFNPSAGATHTPHTTHTQGATVADGEKT